jgi:transcriptional antiterminator RfaH
MNSRVLLETDPRWRVVRAKPKCEHLATRHLAAEGVEAFCPRLRHQKATARGRVWFVEALFPGYLFARFAYAPQARLVQATSGVLGMLHFSADAGVIPDQLVQEMRAEFFSEDEMLTVPTTFHVGEEVEITDGPLRGTRATVSKLMPAKQRVCILMEFLGGLTEMEVPLLSLLGLRDVRQTLYAA